MFYLEKEFRFEAAHQLAYHNGKCQRLHGHSWRGRVVVSREKLQLSGSATFMVVDYGDIAAIIDPVVDKFLDHWNLNDTLHTGSPTSEFIAEWVWNIIYAQIAELGVTLRAVMIDETCTSRCIYTGGADGSAELWV